MSENKLTAYTPFATRTHEEMKEVLMRPEAEGPKVHYYMIRGGTDKRNITVWENGTVGDEYIKAYGHYHVYPFVETYTILEGEGILLLQERALDASGQPENDKIISASATYVRAGDVVSIPEGSGHLLVNIGSTWLVTSDNSPVDFAEANAASMPAHADYTPIHDMHGFAYYVVSIEGKPAFVNNTRYTEIPEITIHTKAS